MLYANAIHLLYASRIRSAPRIISQQQIITSAQQQIITNARHTQQADRSHSNRQIMRQTYRKRQNISENIKKRWGGG